MKKGRQDRIAETLTFEDTFSNAKTFRLKNYTYICSKLGFSYEENPSKKKKFKGLPEPYISRL